MRYNEIKEETHRRILNASGLVDIYKNLSEHPYNDMMKEKYLNEFDYYETIEGMLNRFENSLTRWLELLETDGIDSKNMVATDIQKLLEEIKQ